MDKGELAAPGIRKNPPPSVAEDPTPEAKKSYASVMIYSLTTSMMMMMTINGHHAPCLLMRKT